MVHSAKQFLSFGTGSRGRGIKGAELQMVQGLEARQLCQNPVKLNVDKDNSPGYD